MSRGRQTAATRTRYDAVLRQARRLGFEYVDGERLLSFPIDKLLDRLEALSESAPISLGARLVQDLVEGETTHASRPGRVWPPPTQRGDHLRRHGGGQRSQATAPSGRGHGAAASWPWLLARTHAHDSAGRVLRRIVPDHRDQAPPPRLGRASSARRLRALARWTPRNFGRLPAFKLTSTKFSEACVLRDSVQLVTRDRRSISPDISAVKRS